MADTLKTEPDNTVEMIRGWIRKNYHIFIAGGLVLGLGLLNSVAEPPKLKPQVAFEIAYQKALRQYGNTDLDGTISAEEKQIFEQAVFGSKGIAYKGIDSNSSTYFNQSCERVPWMELTRILSDYQGVK